MADKSIDQLNAAEKIYATDLFVLQQSGSAKKLTGQILLNWLTAAADGHGGIQSIAKLSTSGLVDTYRITLADTTTFDFAVTNGRSITGISKTSTSGLVDTYTIRYNNDTTSTFTVKNGEKGATGAAAYIWIKYASQKPTESSHSIGDIPDNWIGIYSGTIIPSGNWSDSVPVVAQGKYLWTRTTSQFNTGDPIVAYSVARMGKDGAGSVSMVNNVSPDSSGNVTLAAADVGALPTAGGDMIGPINMNGQTLSGLNSPTEDAQAATKGYVDLAAYPVGAIYLSAVATSPASLFGGTWERLKDRFLLGAGDKYNAGSTGGEATHKLTVSEIPSHNHVEMYGDKPWGDDSASGSSASTNTATWNAIETKKTNMTGSTGGGNAHNNMPPYLVVYMWKRTA